MPRPRKGDRALGPYGHEKRLVRYVVDGIVETKTYASEGEALKKIAAFNRAVIDEGRTVSAAIDRYERALEEKGNDSKTIGTTLARLRALLDVELDLPSSELTPARAAVAYRRYRTAPSKRTKKPPAPTTAINVLGEARTFGRWLAKGGWTRRPPFDDVEAVGSRDAGKEQLTIDEARKLEAHCLAHAFGDDGAVAVLMALYFGIRATEITSRTARDLDDGGTVLRVRRLKKKRRVEELFPVPSWFRPHLKRLAGQADEELFAGDRHWLGRECRRLCREAKVPVLGPHSLRGSLGSNAREVVGLSEEELRRLFGHESAAVTRRHYVDDAAEVRADVAERLEVLEGGRRG